MLAFLTACVLTTSQRFQVSFDYAPFTGLTVTVDGVPLVESSGFQYYAKGWKRGIYSSCWAPVEIKRLGDGSTQVRYSGDNGNAVGTHLYTPTRDGFKVHYEFRWRGSGTVMLEPCIARIWAPLVEHATIELDGSEIRDLNTRPEEAAGFEQRLLGSPANRITIEAPFGSAEVIASKPIKLVDTRDYDQEWARGRELLWLGYTAQAIQPQSSLIYDVEWKINRKPQTAPDSQDIAAQFLPVNDALRPESETFPLIPQPESIQKAGGFTSISGNFEFIGSDDEQIERWFRESFAAQWLTKPSEERFVIKRVAVSAGHPQGYQLDIVHGAATIRSHTVDGFRNGLASLLGLIAMRSGELSLPLVTIRDKPKLSLRGVHMFVGPTALNFQTKLMNRVLAPLKFNEVVLECSRTDWEATPGIETKITMAKSDLKSLAARYQESGIEVVPLIQSLGHAEWIFANGKNLDLALNPSVPYTLDPRKKRSAELLKSIWKEATEVIHPSMVHFGMDEIDSRGLPDNHFFTSRLWELQMPVLMSFSREMSVKPMIWGDVMLHASEAKDATSAPSAAVARERRKLIPANGIVVDWHYQNNPQTSAYPSLKLFQKAGAEVIAASWFRPNNVRGHTLAAIKTGAMGSLQTTWAGYESSQANMIRSFEQFSAYVLAADYAWSGRLEMPEDLPYNPHAYLRDLYFDLPSPTKPVAGTQVSWGDKQKVIGDVSYRLGTGKPLWSITSYEGLTAPHLYRIPVRGSASRIAIAMSASSRLDEGDNCAKLMIETDQGKITHDLCYGLDIRTPEDARDTIRAIRSGEVCSSVFDLGESYQIKSITFQAVSPAAGAKIYGVTLIQ